MIVIDTNVLSEVMKRSESRFARLFQWLRSKPAHVVYTTTVRLAELFGGGIAAYKTLDLIRRLGERGARTRCILTAAAQEFITPLAAGALCGERAFTDLFDPVSEFEVGHIRLAREADLVVIAPATADL